MTLDDALEALELAGSTLPNAAMRWLLDHWDQAGPATLARLDAFLDESDTTDGNEDALFFLIHLAAEKQDTRIYPGFCRLLLDDERAEAILGEGILITCSAILTSVFNGDVAPMKAVIELAGGKDSTAREALTALSYLTRTGRIPMADTQAYLVALYDGLLTRADHPGWWAWVDAIAGLGLSDLVPLVHAAYADKRLNLDELQTLKQFEDDLAQTLADPTGMARYVEAGIGPFTNAIGTLSNWYSFSAAARREELRETVREARIGAGVTEPREHRNVGRNEPCPCGSGKKYKKCCLIAA